MLTLVRRTTSLVIVVVLGMATISAADDPSAQASQGSDNGPIVSRATVKVEQGRLVTSVTAKGTLEGEQRTEIRVRLKSWAGPLIVEHAAEQGWLVKKGDALLKFDAEKLDQLVRETREDRESSTLALRLAEHELPLLKQHLPLDLQAAERSKDQAGQELQQFLLIEKAQEIEAAEFALRSAEFNVEYARDELTQLEKMYRDKDLTEETEQMILKRYQFTLASAELSLSMAKVKTEKTLKVTIPRQEEAVKVAAEKAALAWEKAHVELPLQLRQKELALEKLRHADRLAKDKLADLEHDLRQMTVAAPVDGRVFYGRYAHGQWTGPAASAYLKGGTLPANDVVLTIISDGKLLVRAEVEEKEFGEIKVGQAARLSPTIAPRRKLNGTVHQVVPVPQGGKYEVLIALTDDAPDTLVPGMTGAVKIVTAQNDAAVSVPSSAVFEEADGDGFYVYKPGDKPIKQVVKIGMVAGDKTEILDGLKAGDEILAAKP